MGKLKFFVVGLCMIFALMACENPSSTVDHSAEFLGKVAGKKATGNMGPMTISYVWTADGKTLTFTVPGMGGGETVEDYTFAKATSPLNATYTGKDDDNNVTEQVLAVNADGKGGTLTATMGELSFTFDQTIK